MRNTFKLSTFVLKLAFFSLVVSSLFLVSARSQAMSENDKMIHQHVRLSLWYTGIEKSDAVVRSGDSQELPEELAMALLRLDKERNPLRK